MAFSDTSARVLSALSTRIVVPLGTVASAVPTPGGLAGDAAPLVDRVLEAMGPRARPIPALVIHGTADPAVSPVNGRQVAAVWRAGAGGIAGGVGYVARRPVQRGVPQPVDRGRPGSGSCAPTELGHAWSGGSQAGSFTDPERMDATAAVFDFFLDPAAGGGGD